jgi:CHAP domain
MSLHSPLLKSPEVGKLQELLKDHGYYHGAIDNEFGILTYQAVYRAWYWLGRPKPVHVAGPGLIAYLTGTKTPVTWNAYRALRQRKGRAALKRRTILIEAISHLGTKESPPDSNRTIFTAWYGMVGSWCAMFVSYCGVKVGLKSFSKGSRWAYVPFVVAAAREGRYGLTVVHWSDVKPNDLVCYDWSHDGTADHIGVFEKKTGEFSFTAIEGNTSGANDSDGGEVMRRDRHVNLVQVFVRVHG